MFEGQGEQLHADGACGDASMLFWTQPSGRRRQGKMIVPSVRTESARGAERHQNLFFSQNMTLKGIRSLNLCEACMDMTTIYVKEILNEHKGYNKNIQGIKHLVLGSEIIFNHINLT